VSRRSTSWKRKARQVARTGGNSDALIPHHAVGRGTWQQHGPCLNNGNRRSGIVGDGHVCTRGMRPETEARVRRVLASVR
jgi:hypothetical protein